ncbi:MAG: hypothetical protein JRI92_03435, partial [Deltaproteobacteria bacterium]|nr:hypothetical protein [Deltaproteobacteria bacterium]
MHSFENNKYYHENIIKSSRILSKAILINRYLWGFIAIALDNDLLWIRILITTRDKLSEDMDFTLNPEKEEGIINDDIYSAFKIVFNEIKEAANIDLSIPEDSKEVH